MFFFLIRVAYFFLNVCKNIHTYICCDVFVFFFSIVCDFLFCCNTQFGTNENFTTFCTIFVSSFLLSLYVYYYLRLHECASKKERKIYFSHYSARAQVVLKACFHWSNMIYMCACDCIEILICFSHCIPNERAFYECILNP